jgi:hypothetical protein
MGDNTKVEKLDRGTPPASVRSLEFSLDDDVPQADFAGKDKPTSNATMSEFVAIVDSTHQSNGIRRLPQRETKGAVLRHVLKEGTPGLFTLRFPVYEFSQIDNCISLMVAENVSLSPDGAMYFDLEYEGRTYPVVFCGGLFSFPAHGFQGISFLYEPERAIRKDGPSGA